MQTVSRLIEQFIPEHYELTIDMNRPERTFSGTVAMDGEAVNDTNSIRVHAKDLIIASIAIDDQEALWNSGENDEIIVHTDDIITSGKHRVRVVFSGTITDAMHGLYPCYFEHEGVKKELLATQFESHHAREVFPCIDEPAAKAVFDVTLLTERAITVLGNMPIRSQQERDEQLETTFETTPRMSTYLLAWVVGELHCKTAYTKSGVEVNVWATLAQPDASLDFALDIATRSIDFYNDYFDTPYPLPKSDHVALPDFSSGAMENWGLITYREVALLADPAIAGVSSQHYIATVIAHELAHQWFGNLVTMRWWNNLWLNESFATLMEYIAIDALHPEWNVWLDFATAESISALRRDSIDGVQAVQVDVNHPDEISTLFDSAIVYAKGARLLRMLQHYIGHDAFQTGLKAYFATHAYKNTEGDDLWDALSKASNKDIASFMNTWISQSGYPVVHLSQEGNTLTLSQEQFFVGPHEPSQKLWPIPLNTSSNDLPKLLETQHLNIPRIDKTTFRLNVGNSAHFITQYNDEFLREFTDDIRKDTLEPLDRLQLLNEQTLLARSGSISTATLIPLLSAFEHESAEAVWDIISMTIGELKKFTWEDAESEKKLRLFAASLAMDQYKRLGWNARENEPQTDTKLRAVIIGMMLYSENQEIINDALDLYASTPFEKLDGELRALIIGTMVRHGDDNNIVDTLIKQYKKTSSADLQQDIASGLTSTKDTRVIRMLLDTLKNDTIVRPQDAMHWFIWLIRNRDGRVLAWQWLRDNWTWIEKTYGGDKSYDYFPKFAGGTLITALELEEYRIFFTPMLTNPSLERAITIGMSEIEGRIQLLDRDTVAVREALNSLPL